MTMNRRDFALAMAAVGTGLSTTAVFGKSAAKSQPPKPLKFRPDGSFKIVAFGDVHWRTPQAEELKSREIWAKILDAEKPDLVVYCGDFLWGDKCIDPAAAMRDLTQPVVEREIAWTAVLGNHDRECVLEPDEIIEGLMELPGCLAQKGPAELPGSGNYSLAVNSSDGERPAALLYGIDTLRESPIDLFKGRDWKGYAWVTFEQINWYRKESEKWTARNGGKPLPSLMFTHIPLPEYKELWEDGAHVGVKQENVCCSKLNSGLLTSMVEKGDVSGVFCGHDHVNDFIGPWPDIFLGYVRGCSYSGYGKEGYLKGARVIQLREGKRDFSSWLRLEDGQRIDQVKDGKLVGNVHRPPKKKK
jgi:Calcineurin-like phosphoesterase